MRFLIIWYSGLLFSATLYNSLFWAL